MARDRDGSRATARNLGVLSSAPKRVRGSLSSVDDISDFYSFRLSERSSVAFVLNQLRQNANLGLLDSRGRLLATSERAGRNPEAIRRTLDAGLYYVRAVVFGTSTSYLLQATATPTPAPIPAPTPTPGSPSPTPTPGVPSPTPTPAIPTNLPRITPAPEPGNIPALAFDTGNIGASKVYRDTVGGADSADYYRFTVTQSSQVNIVTGNVTGGSVTTNLVYDINGNGFLDAGDEIDDGSALTKSLGVGTYFVGVTSNTPNVTYELLLEGTTITNLNPIVDPPFGLGGAIDLGAVSGLVSRRQLVGSTDSTDIYKFTLTGVSNLTTLLNTTQTTGDVTLSLIYDNDGNGIANPGILEDGLVIGGNFIGGVFTGGGSGGAALAINKTLGAGTYYIAVTQKELVDNTTYDFSLFVNNTVTGITPVGDPGNSIPAVRDNPADSGNITLNAPGVPLNIKQFVGSVDGGDYYRFTITQPQNLIISYNGSPELVALRLGIDRNNDGTFLGLDEQGFPTYVTGEDTNFDGRRQRSEADKNNNGIFELNEVFGQQLGGDVVYSPLPPFFDSSASFSTDTRVGGFLTTVPTNIYARLQPGTYYLEIDPQATTVDLGDGLTRYGTANVLYNLSFLVEPAL
jgi:hypothetical protein